MIVRIWELFPECQLFVTRYDGHQVCKDKLNVGFIFYKASFFSPFSSLYVFLPFVLYIYILLQIHWKLISLPLFSVILTPHLEITRVPQESRLFTFFLPMDKA